MYRKEAVIKAGLYPKNALDFEDHVLWRNLLSVGKLCNLHTSLLKFRFDPESVTLDERWRGKEFLDIRRRAVERGWVCNEDAVKLQRLMKVQNLGSTEQLRTTQ